MILNESFVIQEPQGSCPQMGSRLGRLGPDTPGTGGSHRGEYLFSCFLVIRSCRVIYLCLPELFSKRFCGKSKICWNNLDGNSCYCLYTPFSHEDVFSLSQSTHTDVVSRYNRYL